MRQSSPSSTSPVAPRPAVGQGSGGSGTPAPFEFDPLRAAEVYQGLRAQREILGEQLTRLEQKREELSAQLRQAPAPVERTGVEQRIALIDQQIASVSLQIAEADAKVAQAAATPGATIEPPGLPEAPFFQTGPSTEFVAFVLVLGALMVSPLIIAWTRRIWRRSAAPAALPSEFAERMSSLERSIDTVAIEVERIGEGQRFVTQLLAERSGALSPSALPAATARPLQSPPEQNER